jgi:transcriptional regulator with XRE-family HTH domain
VTDLDDRRAELRGRLRDLRLGADISGAALARALGWSAQSKVSRIETGGQAITDDVVTEWCAACGAGREVADDLLAEARAIRVEASRWQRRLRRGNAEIIEGSGADRLARTIRVVELTVIPGYLQTAAYARWVLESAAALHRTPPDVAAAVGARMDRAQALYEPGRRIDLLMSELVLLSCPPELLPAQVDRLLTLQDLPGVRVAVVPAVTSFPAIPSSGFWIFDDERVQVEINHQEVTVVDPDDVAVYLRLQEALWSVAVEGAEARVLARAAVDSARTR